MFTYASEPPTTAFSLRISPRGSDELQFDTYDCGSGAGTIGIQSSGGPATLTLDGLGAPVSAAPQVDRWVVTYTFDAPQLVALLADPERDPFACVVGVSGASDDFYGEFPGRSLYLTRELAKAGLDTGLGKRFRGEYGTATRKFALCPESGIYRPEGDTPAQIVCSYSYVIGDRYRSGLAAIELQSGLPVIGGLSTRVYPTSRKDCGRAPLSTMRWSRGVPRTAFAHAWGRNVSCGTARKVAAIVWRNRPTYYRCRFTKDTKRLLAGRCTLGRRTVWVEMGPDAF